MDFLTLAYTLTGLVFGAAFVPQILTLIKDNSGAAALNLSTWATFTLCNAVTFAYALVHVKDPYFIFCTSICLVGNLTVFLLGSWRRYAMVPVRSSSRLGRE